MMSARRSIRRGPLVVVGASCLTLTLLLGLRLRGNPYPTKPDVWIWRAVDSARVWRFLDVLFLGNARSVVSDFAPAASPGTAIVVAVGLFLVFRWAGRHRAAWFCLGAPALSLMVTEWVGKPLFHRTLGSSLAYPSGHTTAAVSLGTLLVLLGWRSGGIRRGLVVAALWSVPAISMILFLLLLRAHYPSDIVGGVGVGIGVPCLLAAALFGNSRAPGPMSPAARDEPRPGSAERTGSSGDASSLRRYRTTRGRLRHLPATPGPAGRGRRNA